MADFPIVASNVDECQNFFFSFSEAVHRLTACMHIRIDPSIFPSIDPLRLAGWLAGLISKSTHSFKYRANNREDIGRGSRDRKESTTITPLGYACLSVCLSVCLSAIWRKEQEQGVFNTLDLVLARLPRRFYYWHFIPVNTKSWCVLFIFLPHIFMCCCAARLLSLLLPTAPFTILEPRFQEFYVVQKRHVTDFKAPKLWNGRSGSSLSSLLSATLMHSEETSASCSGALGEKEKCDRGARGVCISRNPFCSDWAQSKFEF